MQDAKADQSWLGAEALPGGLAEINRINQAHLEGEVRVRQAVYARPGGIFAAAMRLMRISPRSAG